MLQRILCGAVITALASPAFAQWQPYGNIIMDGSQNMVTVNLGFNFTMPGGNVVTAVDVDEHGRVIEVGIDTYDSSESTSEMTGNPGGSINVLWDTVSYTASENSTVFFYTDNASVAAVTWYEVNSPGNTTFQLQMHASGDIYMLYDSRNPVDDGIIGLCPGNSAILPAQSDLSTALGAPLVTTDPTIFEDFGFTAGVDAVDWVSSMFMYAPTGAGGSGGWIVTGVPGIPDPMPADFAVNEDLGTAGCPTQAPTPAMSYTFTPDGLGNYDITSGPSLFDANIGASLGVTADDTRQDGFDFGFPFTWEDGYTASGFSIDPNGRLLPDNTTDLGDFSPSTTDLASNTAIAVFWIDMNVNEPNSGNIHMNTVPGVSATITWNDVKQYDATDTGYPGLTTQITVYSSGVFTITHEDIEAFNTSGHPSRDDLIVGTSNGNGIVPAELDLTGLSAVATNVPAATVFEYWDASAGVEPTDLINYLPPQADLVGLSTPLLGTTWQLQIQNAGASLFGLYAFGLSAASVDLTPFGSPCNLLVNYSDVAGAFPLGGGMMTTFDLNIPNNPALVGFEVVVQGVTEGQPTPPYSGFAGLPFRLGFTNGILGRIGSI